MNYLAHFCLSFGQEPLIVGNLLGDFVRGRLDNPRNAIYPEAIRTGIKLHRHIDSFTDTHPEVKICRDLLPNKFGHYKGVIVDMYFDYFLAKNFADYHSEPLSAFAQNVYRVLTKNDEHIPESAKLMVKSMIKYDWLTHYQYMEGMRRSFAGMAKRFEILKGIDEADEELQKNEQRYEPHFRAFFPQLEQNCREFML